MILGERGNSKKETNQHFDNDSGIRNVGECDGKRICVDDDAGEREQRYHGIFENHADQKNVFLEIAEFDTNAFIDEEQDAGNKISSSFETQFIVWDFEERSAFPLNRGHIRQREECNEHTEMINEKNTKSKETFTFSQNN